MKKQLAVLAVLAALAVVGTIVMSRATAQQQQGPQTSPKSYSWQNSPTNPPIPQTPEPQTRRFQPHDTSELPFGSAEWWKQMQREDKARN